MPDSPVVHALTPAVTGYFQPPGGWFRNNAGWIAGRDRTLLVDTCATEARTRRLLRTLRERAGDRPLTAVLTHAHGDHANGANQVARGGGTILASAPAAAEIAAGPHTYPALFQCDTWGEIAPPAGIEPVSAGRQVDLGDQVVEVVPVPHRAHTAGDLVVWTPQEGVLFAGDLLFHGVVPLAVSGSVGGWLAALDWLDGFGARQVVPGHGALTDYAEARAAQTGYLHWLLDTVADTDEPDFATLARQANARWPRWLDRERHALNLRVAHAETHGQQFDLATAAAAMLAATGGPIPLDI